MEIIWRVIIWERGRENRGKGAGVNKHNWYIQNSPGNVKNNIGNGEAKELICTMHGHELSGGLLEGREVPEEGKGGKTGATLIT